MTLMTFSCGLVAWARGAAETCARGTLAGAVALTLGGAFAANAQTACDVGRAQRDAGLFAESRQPIQIEAASLEMRDKKKEATFSGNVKVVQGDTTMTSKSLVVFLRFELGRLRRAAWSVTGIRESAGEIGADAGRDPRTRRRVVDQAAGSARTTWWSRKRSRS